MDRKNESYIPRLIDDMLKLYLESSGAVLIQGPKWCGKTTTAKQVAGSVAELGDPDKADEYLALASIAPSRLLEGPEPRLIDEWQLIPKLWDSVRTMVDRRGGFGHFILTGSATPLKKKEDKRHHSGTGRISRLTMRSFTLQESEDSNGSVSLSSLFNSCPNLSSSNPMDIERLAYLCSRGGWPEVCINKNLSLKASLRVSHSYVESICSNEFETEDEIIHDKDKMALFLRSYARNIGTQISIPEIINDLTNGSFSFSEKLLITITRHCAAYSLSKICLHGMLISDRKQLSEPLIPDTSRIHQLLSQV